MIEKSDSTLFINSETDIVGVRRTVRLAAENMEFGITDITRIVTAASELSRNISLYAGSGTVRLIQIEDNGKKGLELKFEDEGPGIADLDIALAGGHSTSGGLGMGIPGTKRLMDEMIIETCPGQGTTIIIRKWLKK